MKIEEGKFIPRELEQLFRKELTIEDRKKAKELSGQSYSMVRDLSYGSATVTKGNRKSVLALMEVLREKLESREESKQKLEMLLEEEASGV